LRQVQRAAETGLLPGVQRGLQALLPYFPQLLGLVREVATAMGDAFELFLRSLTSPQWQSFFSYLRQIARPTLLGIAKFMADIGRGVADLLVAFRPVTAQIGRGLLGLARSFAQWASTLDSNQGFQRFLAYVLQAGPEVMRTLGRLAQAGARLVQALAPIGGLVLRGIQWFSRAILAVPVDVLTVIIGLILGIAAAVKLVGLAMAAWSLLTNPVGLVIAAVALLAAGVYLLWTRSETFRTVVTAAWHGIAAAAQVAWETVLRPALTALRTFLVDVLAPAAVWLWHSILEPAFRGIAAVVSWAWTNLISPALSGFAFFVRNFVVPVVLLLWHGIVEPAFTGITLAIRIAWTAIRIILGLFEIFIRTVVAPTVTWLWRTIVRPTFEAISQTIQYAWNRVIHPTLKLLGDFIETYVAPAFNRGVDAVGKAWERVRDIAKAPVKFVVQTVINDGIIGAYNWLAGKVGVDKIDPVKLPPGFARGGVLPNPLALAGGGVLPGYTPGRDVHRFYSATGGALDLSGGEAVMRPEFTAALGVASIDAANLAARRRGIRGVREWLLELFSHLGGDQSTPLGAYLSQARARGGYLGGFDRGGILGTVTGALGKAWDSFTDPVGVIKDQVTGLIRRIPGVGLIHDVAVGVGKRLLGGAVDWAKHAVGSFFGLDGGPATGKIGDIQHWIKAQAGKPYVWAGVGPQGWDCSGIVSAVYRLVLGKSPNTRVFSTANEAGFFLPGAGVHTAGWAHAGERGGGSVGHTAGRLAGLKYEATPPRVKVGPAAADVTSFAHVGHQPGLAQGGIWQPTLYDSGGWLPTGLSLARNDTGQPEVVLTNSQWQQMRAATAGNGVTYQTNVYPQQANLSITDLAQLQTVQEIRARVGRKR
jgi:hypothetical protein